MSVERIVILCQGAPLSASESHTLVERYFYGALLAGVKVVTDRDDLRVSTFSMPVLTEAAAFDVLASMEGEGTLRRGSLKRTDVTPAEKTKDRFVVIAAVWRVLPAVLRAPANTFRMVQNVNL